METSFAWILAAILATIGIALYVVAIRRAEASIRTLSAEKDRALAEMAALASNLRASDAARKDVAKQLEAFRQEQARNAAEWENQLQSVRASIDALRAQMDGAALPTIYGAMAERTASLIIARLPDSPDRELVVASANLGALLTVHGFVGHAAEMMHSKIVDTFGEDAFSKEPIYSLDHYEDAAFEPVDADGDGPPSSRKH